MTPPPASVPSPRISRRLDPSAFSALVGMAVARLIRGRRLILLAILSSLPVVLAALARRRLGSYNPAGTELSLIFGLIPQTLLPLTALIFSSGMIQDEVEEQTLTYLLIRPVPRTAIYLAKLLGTLIVSAALTITFTTLTLIVIHGGELGPAGADFPRRPLLIAGAMSLALATYAGLFGLAGLYFRRALVLGVAYIAVFEGILANVDFLARRFTIMYQFRVLTTRLLDLRPSEWSINLADAPSTSTAAASLGIAAFVLALAGGLAFSRREFRVKTPDGN